MPRSQPYDPSFSYDLGEGYLMNPRSGEIFNTANNTVYADYNELGMEIQKQSAGIGQSSDSQSSNNNSLISGAGTIGAGYVGQQLASQGGAQVGGQVAGQVGGQVAGQGGAQVGGQVAGQGSGQAAGAAGLGGQIGGGIAYNAAALYQGQKLGRDNYANYGGKNLGDTVLNEGLESLTMGNYGGFDPINGLVYSTPITAPIPLTMAIAGSLFGGNARVRAERDNRRQGRKGSQDLGLMEKDSRSMWNQYDGNRFDIRDFKTKTGTDAYKIDFNQNVDPNDIGFLNALGYAQYGGKSNKDGSQNKLISDMAGEMYNAGKNSGDIKANNRFYGDKLGGAQVIKETIAQRWREGKITAQQRDAGFAATDKEYGILNPNNQRWEDGAGLSEKDIKRNQTELAFVPKAPKDKAPASTTKPITAPSPLSTSSTGGKPATAINTGTFRPGASANPNFKNQPYKIPKKK